MSKKKQIAAKLAEYSDRRQFVEYASSLTRKQAEQEAKSYKRLIDSKWTGPYTLSQLTGFSVQILVATITEKFFPTSLTNLDDYSAEVEHLLSKVRRGKRPLFELKERCLLLELRATV